MCSLPLPGSISASLVHVARKTSANPLVWEHLQQAFCGKLPALVDGKGSGMS